MTDRSDVRSPCRKLFPYEMIAALHDDQCYADRVPLLSFHAQAFYRMEPEFNNQTSKPDTDSTSATRRTGLLDTTFRLTMSKSVTGYKY